MAQKKNRAEGYMVYFDEYLRKAKDSDELTIDKTWSQGRTTFGGISAAILLEKMNQQILDEKTIKSLSLVFSAPLLVDVPFQLQVESWSSGKSTCQLQAKAIQDKKVCIAAIATFGKPRISHICHRTDRVSTSTYSDQKKLSYIENITPVFLQHFDLHLIEGDLPFSGNKLSHLSGWASFAKDVELLSPAHILALTDAWPPTILQNYKKPGPGATAHWNVSFVDLMHVTDPVKEKVYFSSTVTSALEGYAHTEAKIFSQEGEQVATSSQLVMGYE